jgi:hypothetical protein
MSDDDQRPKKHSNPSDDNQRTKEAKRVAEEYATGLREFIQKLRRLFH